jgi:hypothetical protein
VVLLVVEMGEWVCIFPRLSWQRAEAVAGPTIQGLAAMVVLVHLDVVGLAAVAV